MDTYFNTEERNVAPIDFELAEANQRFMVKVYGWMCFALAVTGFMSLFIVHFEPLMNFFVTHTGVFIFLLIAEVLLVGVLSARVQKMSLFACTLIFLIYSILNGITLAPLFLVYTSSSIASTFFIVAGTFAAMSLFGYVTKQDLTKWGNILIMALIGLIVATLVNLFIKSSGLTMILSYVGVLVFVGLTAWDSQKIKQMLMQAPDAGESAQKLALLGALTLYLDFINLFIYLLRIFGKRE